MSHDPNNPPVVTIWTGTGLILMSRLLGRLGTPITVPTVSSVRCEVMDAQTEELITALNIASGDVISNSLVTDDERWLADTVGYNFLHEVPASAFPLAGRSYRLSYLFTPLTGQPFPLVQDVSTKKTFAS